MARQLGFIFLFAALVRLTHSQVLWIEEAYPMTAAIQILHGRLPYSDFWYDKPPGAAWLYLLWGAAPGWLLRVVGAGYVTLCAWLAARLGGRYAAWLMAVYLSFGIPSAVMALAPDLLLVAPHLAAVALAQAGQPLLAGLVCGLALLIHTKGVFVLATALLFAPHWRTLAGFAATLPIHFALGPQYWQQVWVWGQVYSTHTFVAQPLTEFIRRTSNWVGFQSAAIVAAALQWRTLGWRNYAWLAIALASAVTGLRFFPRYYFFLLVPVVVLAGRTLDQLPSRLRWAVLALLLVPIVRFGPRDVQLALGNTRWDDLALFEDSRAIAQRINQQSGPQDTLFVWGYRPDIDALTRLRGGTPFLESQPLTCVFADRHLRDSRPIPNAGCEQRVRRFREMDPTWLVDGLGPLNPALRIEAFRQLTGYEVALRTPTAVLYKLVNPPNRNIEARLAPPPMHMGRHVIPRVVIARR